MSFEDDKDILDNSDNISDDDAISWDSIVDTDEDGIVSIKKNPSNNMETEVFANDSSSSDIDTINLDDVIVDDSNSVQTSDNNIDEDELKLILGRDTSDNVEYIDNNDADDTEELNKILMNDNTSNKSDTSATEETEVDDEITPRKEEIKKKTTISPILLALLFAALVSAGVYIAYTLFMNKEDENMLRAQNEQMRNDNPGGDLSEENLQDENISGENAQNAADNQNNDIQVVNEDEASDLIPEEKKEIVSVVPTGRTDPFAPLQKYVYVAPPPPPAVRPSVVVKTINNIDLDSVQIPKIPKAYGELNQIAEKLMTISVTGIMYDKLKPSAIINYENNDYFVQIGDKLDSFKVIDIGPNNVKIALGKNVYKAEVGERFKIQSEFFGNNPYLEGARQYYSSEDEFDKRAENAKKYTSNDDVKIYTK